MGHLTLVLNRVHLERALTFSHTPTATAPVPPTMATNNKDNDEPQHELLSKYFLNRLGLISDEIDWPNTDEEVNEAAEAITSDVHGSGDGPTSWRMRDVVTSILKENGVMCGLDSTDDAGGISGGEGQATANEAVAIDAVLAPLLPSSVGTVQGDEAAGVKLNVKQVQQAFSAAAFAVVRGDGRRVMDMKKPAPTTGAAKTHLYEPPLIQAMESIRTARIHSLNKAASGNAVPAFLKKNNTIPWFHVPITQPANVVSGVLVPPPTGTGIGSTAAGEGTQSLGAKLNTAAKEVVKKDDGKTKKEGSGPTLKPKLSLKRPASGGAIASTSFPESKKIKAEKVVSSSTPSKSKNKNEGADAKGKKVVTPIKRRARPVPECMSGSTFVTLPYSAKSPSRGTTSASTAVDAEHRAVVSRAILCASAAVAFQGLTPGCESGGGETTCGDASMTEGKPDTVQSDNAERKQKKVWEIDLSDVPQNDGGVIKGATEGMIKAKPNSKKETPTTMETVLAQAQTIGKRVIDQATGAARRSDRRREFRIDMALSRERRGVTNVDGGGKFLVALAQSLPLVVSNPFSIVVSGTDSEKADSVDMDTDDEANILLAKGSVCKKEEDAEWTNACLPRMMDILKTGSGHAILHDMEWNNRARRVAGILQNLALPAEAAPLSSVRGLPNYGPHLIITASGSDFEEFASVFAQLGHDLCVVKKTSDGPNRADDSFATDSDDVVLRVLPYHGTALRRRRLRKHFGGLSPSPDSPRCFLGGLPESPYHVILTSFSAFVEDYAHFCQIPFQAVVVDEGMGLLGASHSDPNGKLGKVWNSGMWNNADSGAGVGSGPSSAAWDFSKDDGGVSANGNDHTGSGGKLLVGLTARHRILIASKMHVQSQWQVYKASVPSVLAFLSPQFMDVVRDDWERSKVFLCEPSMSYVQKLIAKSVVVYSGDSCISGADDMITLSLKSMNGGIPSSGNVACSDFYDDDVTKKTTVPKKFANAWFRQGSRVRIELEKNACDPILTAVKLQQAKGLVCEEIATASSMTASGAAGTVTGPSAYRTAVRCGRTFSSISGLRQHIVSAHAPAGTWMCRVCDEDCGTSQGRSHHEKSCGVEDDTPGHIAPAATTGSKRGRSRGRGPEKKEVKNIAAAGLQHDKENDGSTRVPGYKGVWARNDGKSFFVKAGDNVVLDEKSQTLLFTSAEEAGKQYDRLIMKTGRGKGWEEDELNFKADGSRIIHEDEPSSASAGKNADMQSAAASASSIVPALSVVNIKNLPKDVKPLLRDPNQKSRSGGNTKRYIYAYRGVCRQSRKGTDRWQSQISFNGCNHYLGTFDSEWDAAAVYGKASD
eukprot:scaffold4931_cov196-Alexandrium_tamarense.AAC.7